ncbi:hypothetical protein DRN73_08080, partial [Candidatus Pacearchaeota archaeon]
IKKHKKIKKKFLKKKKKKKNNFKKKKKKRNSQIRKKKKIKKINHFEYNQTGKKNIGLRELYIGESKSGKTTLMFKSLSKLLFHPNKKLKSKFKNNLLICLVQPTYHSNVAFKGYNHLKKLFDNKEYCEIYTTWDDYVSRRLHNIMIDKKVNKGKQLIFILDDIGAKNGLKAGRTSQIIKDIGTSAPHFNVILISLFQRFVQAPPDLRQNFDVVHFFRSETASELKAINENFFGTMTFDQFKGMYLKYFMNPFDYYSIERGKGGTRVHKSNGKDLENKALE